MKFLKSLAKAFLGRIKVFFLRDLEGKIDKLLMLESQILSKQNLLMLEKVRVGGGQKR